MSTVAGQYISRVPSTRTPLVILLAALAVVLAFSPRIPQGVFGDQAVQLHAVQQYLAGVSPSFNHVVQPDPADLTRDRRTWLTSHPPGTQLVVYPFVALGIPLATSVRIAAVLALVVGALGWLRWFERFNLPFPVLCAAAGALPCLHEASNGLFVFSQDTLNYAVAPWLLLMTLALVTRSAPAVAWFATGIALGATYIVKYSLLFVGLGALTFLALESVRRRRDIGRVAPATVGCALPIIVMSALNVRFGVAANTVAGQWGFYPRHVVSSLVGLVANPALAAADTEGLILRLSHNNALLASYIGIVGGLALWWLLARAPREAPASRLALVVFIVTLTLMAVVWVSSEAADFEARHVAPASLAVLPVAYLGGVDRWHRGALRRALIAIVGVGFVVLPVVYGLLALAAKPDPSRVGRSGLYNPELASDAEGWIIKRFGPVTDVWYSYDSITGLDLPGRVWSSADNLELPRAFHASRPLRVTALIARRFELDGRGPAIRAMFRGAARWSRTTVPDSNDDVWTTVIAEASNRE